MHSFKVIFKKKLSLTIYKNFTVCVCGRSILIQFRFILMLHMRDQLLKAVLAHAQGEIEKHKANVNVYLEHPAGIGEHSDITEAIQCELDKIARYHDQIEVVNKYFKSRGET